MTAVGGRREIFNASNLSSNRQGAPSKAILAEIKGIPEHFQIRLLDPETNEMYLFDR